MPYTASPFQHITHDSATGLPLSPQALENRKRLILIWKILAEFQATFEGDLNDMNNHTEFAYVGNDYQWLLQTIQSWGLTLASFPTAPIALLEKQASISKAA